MTGRPPSSESPTKRKPPRNKAETHERILSAAIGVFAARGYERASISAIASRAEVSRSAVFWHFGDKESLFRESFRRMLLPFFEEFKSSLEHLEPRKRVSEIFAAYERVVEEHADAIRTIVRWLLESEKLRASLLQTLFQLHGRFIQDLRDAVEEIQGDDAEAAALAAALVSLLDGNLFLAMLDPDPRNAGPRRAGLRILMRRALGEVDGD